MKDWWRSTCLKLPRHSESSSQSPSPVNAKRINSSSVGGSFLNLQSMASPRCSRSRRPRNARPKAAVGCGSSRLLSRSLTWRRLWLAVCLESLVSVLLNCWDSLLASHPLQLSLPHFRSPSQSVSLSQSPSPAQYVPLNAAHFAGLVWKDGVNWPSLQTLSLLQQLSPPSQGSLRRINITSQVCHNSGIPAAIISWVEAGTLTVVFSTHLD